MSSFIGRLRFFYELRQFFFFFLSFFLFFIFLSFLVEFESVPNSFLFFVIQPEHLPVSNGRIMLTGFAIKIKAHQSAGSVVVGFPALPWSNC